MDLLNFQDLFLERAMSPEIRTAVLSLPRGNGKSTLAAHILRRCLTPGDPWNQPGKEYLALAGSVEQARHVFRVLRGWLEAAPQSATGDQAPVFEGMGDLIGTAPQSSDYRFVDSMRSLGVRHKPSRTALRVISSSGKRAMGIVNTPLVVCDEPGSWETRSGELLWDALVTAQGKPDSALRIILIGTEAPAEPSSWWSQLIARGSHGGTYVKALQGSVSNWDSPKEIKRVNPLLWRDNASRKVVLSERDEARRDPRLKARFLSYRLNRATRDETEQLLTPDDWRTILDKRLPERDGRLVVGVDLGGGLSWSAAVAIWSSGRTEAVAVCPGILSIPDMEKRDRVPTGTYACLVEAGVLVVADGLHVPPPAALIGEIEARWGLPDSIVCDRFRLNELRDATGGDVLIEPRVTRWSESSADIRSLRKLALDGALAVSGPARLLLTAAISAAKVETDDAGNARLLKGRRSADCRDDAAHALLMAAGGIERLPDDAGAGAMVLIAGREVAWA